MLGTYIKNNKYAGLLILPPILFFIMPGLYYFNFRKDLYIINITSFRTILFFMTKREHIDISHNMLKEFKIFNRPLSLNKTLMLKLESQNEKKIITRRFNMSVIRKKELMTIEKNLNQIIKTNEKL